MRKKNLLYVITEIMDMNLCPVCIRCSSAAFRPKLSNYSINEQTLCCGPVNSEQGILRNVCNSVIFLLSFHAILDSNEEILSYQDRLTFWFLSFQRMLLHG